LYLSAPHPSAAMRAAIESARRGARDANACAGVREAELNAAEQWRLEHIRRLAAIDPTYPAAYARGVASYRRADYRGASLAFQTWLADHPEGPLSLRARSFLRAAEAQTAE
jgi:TolA-binding protein